jgi:hypothetical protein
MTRPPVYRWNAIGDTIDGDHALAHESTHLTAQPV